MKRRIGGVLCVVFLISFAAPAAAADPAGVAPLPKTMTPWEAENFERMARERMEALYPGFDPSLPFVVGEGPLGIPGMVAAGEFEHVDAVALGVDGPSAVAHPDLFESMAAALNGEVDVWLVTSPGYEPTLRANLINNYGIDPNLSDNTLKIFTTPLDSVWLRDYGPIWVKNPMGRGIMANPMYYPARPLDDDMPYYASAKMDMLITSPTMTFEGGNFLANGEGTCFTTTGVIDGPTGNVWQGWTEADVVQAFQTYFGCTDVIILDRQEREGTTHIDMWASVIDTNTVIVGEYPVAMGTAGCTATRCYPASGVEGTLASALDDANRIILDNNAALLESRGFNVVRVPMPNHMNDVWRTYTNVIIVDSTVMVPVYASGGAVDLAVEAASLQIWVEATGRNIVPIDSESIIFWSGAIHCVSQTWAYGASLPGDSDECVSGTATHCGMPDVEYAEVEEVLPLDSGCAVTRVGDADAQERPGAAVPLAFLALCMAGLAVMRRRR